MSKNLALIVGVLAMVSMGAMATLSSPGPKLTPMSQTTVKDNQGLLTTIAQQPGTPIHISSIEVDSTDLHAPKISFRVENISAKAIAAYAIRCDDKFGHSKSVGFILNNSASVASVLQPGQAKPEFIDGDTYSEKVKQITLSVDFVEFLDGSVWGEDKNHSAEFLAGFRAGARATIDEFTKIMQSGGLQSVKNAIKNNPDSFITPDVSPKWREGFQSGIRAVRARLDQASNKSSIAVEEALQKPLDATSERGQ